jgi:ABC-2 type transport system permease protein
MGNMTEFITGEYYTLLFILILSIYCIMTANQLMTRLIDGDSIAYWQATPNSRQKIALTQAFVLSTDIVMIALITTASRIFSTEWLVSDYSLDR